MTERPEVESDLSEPDKPRAARRMVIVRPKKEAKVHFVTSGTRWVFDDNGRPYIEGTEEDREVVREEIELLGSLTVQDKCGRDTQFQIEFECPLCKQVLIFQDFHRKQCVCGKRYGACMDSRIPLEVYSDY